MSSSVINPLCSAASIRLAPSGVTSFGVAPKYTELFSESGDIYSSIQAWVLNRSGYLYDKPHFLLQQEVTEIGSYFSFIKAVAAGNSGIVMDNIRSASE